MYRKKLSLEDEINEMLKVVHGDFVHDFFEELYLIFNIFNVTEDDDWVKTLVGEDNFTEVRFISTCYIFSRMAERFSSKFSQIKSHFPEFWKRLEEHVLDQKKLMQTFEVDESI